MVGLGALVTMRATGSLVDRYPAVVLPLTCVVFGLAAVLPSLARTPVVLAASLLVLGAAPPPRRQADSAVTPC
jgi:hypothetical protein